MKKITFLFAILFEAGLINSWAQNNSLNFDGVNDYVQCGNVMPSTYTKEAWIKITNFGTQDNIISGGEDGQHAFWAPTEYGNKLSAGHNYVWDYVQDPTPLESNIWYHVAVTYNAATTTMKLYKNGILVSTNTSTPPFTGGNTLRIGAYEPESNLFAGMIDEVRVWNIARTQSDIKANMNASLTGNETGLVAYYRFNQGIAGGNNASVTVLDDLTVNNNDGQLINFALTGNTSNWVAGMSPLQNTSYGTNALSSNIYGLYNSAFGYYSLYKNTTGNNNTASGAATLTSNITGSNNTAIGFSALTSNTGGTSNTATGYLALTENTTGRGNTGTGWSALSNNTTGIFNTALGNNANISLGDITNSTAIGRASLATACNQVRIGSSSVTSIGGYTGWSNISDGRYKKNLKENVPGLEFINALRPVTYNLKVTELDGFLRRGMRKTGKNDESFSQQDAMDKKATAEKERIIYTGFIAQEVERAAKEIGYDFSGVDAPKNDHDVYALRYAEFVVPLVKAVQELSQQNDQLTNELAEIKKLLIQQRQNDPAMSYSSPTNGDEKLSVTVSPNPVRSILNVSIKGNCIRPVITALDMYGKILFVRSVTQNQTELDVSKLSAGTYIIKITDADGKQVYSGKFIKQN